MNARTVLGLSILFLSGCAAPAPTLTPVPPTTTRTPPTIAPTATPVPPTATQVPPTATTTTARGVTFTWYGQSMFTLKVENGPTIMTDPVNPRVGYKVSPVAGIDVVTVSHEHSDHNEVSLASGSPKVLRGLAGNDWVKVDETIQAVRVRTVNTFHDDSQGSARGKNAVFVFEANNLRIAHMGDLGHLLTPEQIAAVGPVDVVLIPVGSTFTIDAARATQVVDSLKPRAVIPMHYKTPMVQLNLEPVDAFLAGKTVERVKGNQVALSAASLPKATTVYVLGYEPAPTARLSVAKQVDVAGGGSYGEATPEELNALLAHKDFFFLNVHTPYQGEIADTDAFIAYDQVEKNLDRLPLDKNANIVLYCRSGAMSNIASQTLVRLGYTNVYHLGGGMSVWKARGFDLLDKPK